MHYSNEETWQFPFYIEQRILRVIIYYLFVFLLLPTMPSWLWVHRLMNIHNHQSSISTHVLKPTVLTMLSLVKTRKKLIKFHRIIIMVRHTVITVLCFIGLMKLLSCFNFFQIMGCAAKFWTWDKIKQLIAGSMHPLNCFSIYVHAPTARRYNTPSYTFMSEECFYYTVTLLDLTRLYPRASQYNDDNNCRSRLY